MAKDLFQNLPFDDDTLAALVEGELSPQQIDAIRERLLTTNPDLAAAIEQMASDRVLLRALGDERPPAGLAESITARLEREALIGLAQGEPTSGTLRVSTVHHARPRGGSRWLTGRVGAGLAVAAMLALAVGVALQFVGPRAPKLDPGPIADHGEKQPAEGPLVAIEQRADPAAKVSADVAPTPQDEPQTLALARPDPAPAPEWRPVSDIDTALALLAEGRLVVRLRAASPDDALSDLSRLADQPDRPGKAFRIQHEVASAVALAMEQRFAPAAAEPIAYADSSQHDPVRPAPVARRSPLEGVYMADARLDKAALLSLQAALSLGDGRVAQFEELPEPLELPHVLTPDAVLWWSRPPSEWTSRAFVPVVVERIDR
ncbi:MAG: hypothetical protein IPJ41_01240 [Phycisphaerales bacterium]|nr:hypothetical protein [Phycisphaerales bacterium]